ncbi:hypothetical protein ADL03_20510 [Nocardia sp. NRRL S-836]|nr:hypothetical protein ADL03_20510 [Nocardia sp. NRRL S-836]
MAWVQPRGEDEVPVIQWKVPEADRYQLLVVDEPDVPHVIGEAGRASELPYAPFPADWGVFCKVRALRGDEVLATSALSIGDPQKKADFRGFARSLEANNKGWGAIAPAKPDEIIPGTPKTEIDGDHVKTITPMTMTKTPGALVTFDAAANNTLWPGSIVQGKEAVAGKLVTVGISETKRKKIKIGVSGLTTNKTTASVKPTYDDTLGAIKDAVKDAEPGGRDFYIYFAEGHSAQQLCLELGVSAKYLKFEGSLNFRASTEKYCNTVVAYIRETAFTAMPSVTDLNDFFADTFTEGDLKQLQTDQVVGDCNPPLYVSAVVYGRILFFAVTAMGSTTDIKAAIRASFDGWKISGEMKTKLQALLKHTKTDIVALGKGCPGNIGDLLKGADGLKSYLDSLDNKPAKYGVVGYQLKTFTDQIAKQSETAKYNRTVWEKNALTVEVLKFIDNVDISGTVSFPGEGSQQGTFQKDKTLSPTAIAAGVKIHQIGYSEARGSYKITYEKRHNYEGIAKLNTLSARSLGEQQVVLSFHNAEDTIRYAYVNAWCDVRRG